MSKIEDCIKYKKDSFEIDLNKILPVIIENKDKMKAFYTEYGHLEDGSEFFTVRFYHNKS